MVKWQMKKTVEHFELLFQNYLGKIMKENRENLARATDLLSEFWTSDPLNISFDRSTEDFYYQIASYNLNICFNIITPNKLI
jgi:hypothetical protein